MAIYEIRRSDFYSGILLDSSLMFIECACFFSSIYEKDITNFAKAPKKSINGFLICASFIFISLLFFWIIYYFITENVRKDKNIDETELKMIYSKSISQAVVIFLGVFSIAISGLRDEALLLAIYIITYLTFICPLLDLNKFMREKELEYFEEKI